MKQEYETITLFDKECILLDFSKTKHEVSFHVDRLYHKIYIPWKCIHGQIIKLMQCIAVPDFETGEIRISKVVKLSDNGYGSSAYIITAECNI